MKTALGAVVIMAVVLLGLDTWRDRSENARATGALLRGQIGIALLTIVFFNLPIQLPDVFLSLEAKQFGALCLGAVLLSLSTWSTARWIVVRREERGPRGAALVRGVYAGTALALAVLAAINCAGEGGLWGPLIPLGIGLAAWAFGRVMGSAGPAAGDDDLGSPGVIVPQVLAAIGVTAAAGAAISAASTLAVANGRLWIVPPAIAAGAFAVAGLAMLVHVVEQRLSGRTPELRFWNAEVTTKSTVGGSAGRTRSIGKWLIASSVATAAAVLFLLVSRVEGAQSAGAAAAVIVFLCALTLALGAMVVATDAWDQLLGVPALFRFAGCTRTPLFVLLLVWGVAASSLDDGRHWDVRKLPSDGTVPVTLSQAFEKWEGAVSEATATTRTPVPLIFVATSGGGIRAAYWTALAFDCVFSNRTAPNHPTTTCAEEGVTAQDVFLASGISGGSLGLVEWDAAEDEARTASLPADWVDARLGADFVAPTVAWGLLVEIPRSFLQFPALDRAAVLEDSWEEPWGESDNAMRQGFLEDQREAFDAETWESPLLMLNGSSVLDGCTLNVSLFDEGRTGAEGVSLTDCTAGDDGTLTDEPQGELPMTADVVDYLDCGSERDVRLSTAALLSARFPYVSSAGRLEACRKDESTKYVVDGGYLDTSGADPALAAYLAIEKAIEDYNAREPDSCVVPYFLQLDNGYVDPATPPKSARPPNQLLAPVQTLWASTGLQSRAERARSHAAEIFTRPFETVPGQDESAVVGSRYARIVPTSHPGVEAPLGWTLSEESQRDLEKELYVSNKTTIGTVKSWGTEATCAPLPER